ncbi:MAG: class I SAM-dependent methyltransferase [Hyphomicrobiales bacterium]
MSDVQGANGTAVRRHAGAVATFVERAGRTLLPHAVVGSLTIIFPNGKRAFLGTPNAQPHAVLQLNNYRVIRNSIKRASIGFAESYVAGDVECPDLVSLIRFFILNRAKLLANPKVRAMFKVRAGDKLWHATRRNSPARSKQNIEAHYDLGNDFYATWLDDGMTYSSGLFSQESPTLPAAQDAKYKAVIDALNVEAGGRILEIGCGWGGFAEYATEHTPAHVTGITLSQEQLAYSRERVDGRKARFELCDYRHTEGQYDAIASIEMIEAVGEEHWHDFFLIVRERLKPGASAAVQAITIAEEQFSTYRRKVDFIQRYIFPGGMLPTKTILAEQAAQAGLETETAATFGKSYAHTLKLWRERFDENWENIEKLGFDARFRRMWRYYLAYCEAGFEERVLDVGIYRFTRPQE